MLSGTKWDRSLGWEGQPAQEPMIQSSERQHGVPQDLRLHSSSPHLAALQAASLTTKRKRHKARNPLAACQELSQPLGSSLDSGFVSTTSL